MFLGADFIKTSTGKEGVNASLPVAIVMVRAIREYHRRTGHKVNTASDSLKKSSIKFEYSIRCICNVNVMITKYLRLFIPIAL